MAVQSAAWNAHTDGHRIVGATSTGRLCPFSICARHLVRPVSRTRTLGAISR
jgi:hypothetical protein